MNDMPQTEIPFDTDVVARCNKVSMGLNDIGDVQFTVRDPFRYRGLIIDGTTFGINIARGLLHVGDSYIIRRVNSIPSIVVLNNYSE